jgi:hypothetical protein
MIIPRGVMATQLTVNQLFQVRPLAREQTFPTIFFRNIFQEYFSTKNIFQKDFSTKNIFQKDFSTVKYFFGIIVV